MKKSSRSTSSAPIPAPVRDPLHPEKPLVTRRDFLSSGVVGMSAGFVMPSMLGMLLSARSARAGDSPGGGPLASAIPFIMIDCAGGAALSGNWMMLDQGGQPLPSYVELGQPNSGNYTVSNEFGAPMFGPVLDPLTMKPTTQTSEIYKPIAALDPAIKARIKMSGICLQSLSDSQSNLLNPLSLITSLGSMGSVFRNGVGTRNSPSGGNSDIASLNSLNKPMPISSVDSLSLASSFGPGLSSMPSGMLNALVKGLNRLSPSQSDRFASMHMGDQFKALMGSAYVKMGDFTSPTITLDARQDAQARTIFGIAQTDSATDSNVIKATIAKNALQKVTGPAVITIGGCDYHTANRTSGQTKDAEVGSLIAKIIELADAYGTGVVIQVSTDGGIYSDGAGNWVGDSNGKGYLAMIAVSAPGTAPFALVNKQINYYNTGLDANPADAVINNVRNVSHLVAYNYARLIGIGADGYRSRIQIDPLPDSVLNSNNYAMFAKS